MSAVCGSPLNAIPHTRTRVRSGARPFAAASEDTCSATNCGIESLRQRAASSSSASTASASATPASILVSFLRQDPPTPGPGIAMGLRGYPVLASAMVAGISRPSPDMTLAAMFANAKETSRTAVTQASDRPATSWGSRRSSWTPAPCRASRLCQKRGHNLTSDAWRHRRPEHNQAPGLKRRAHLFAGCSQVVEVRCAVVLDRCGDGNDIERTSGCPSMSGTRPVARMGRPMTTTRPRSPT